LLVLDEPTAGVDAASQQSFAEALRRFVADGGTSSWSRTSSGRCSRSFSRAVVVHQGEIVHDGPVPEPAVATTPIPDHDHVHPHGPIDHPGLWGAP
jgi:zinc transport system ATP-binding protein